MPCQTSEDIDCDGNILPRTSRREGLSEQAFCRVMKALKKWPDVRREILRRYPPVRRLATEHDAYDLRRIKEKRRVRSEQRVRRMALKKLTRVEREALGLR